MSRTIELPDELYDDLERVSREHGLSLAAWIAATLSGRASSLDERPLSDLMEGLIGVVDSSKEPPSGYARKPFNDLIARKLEGQGLRRP